jgi:hypothetical protein
VSLPLHEASRLPSGENVSPWTRPPASIFLSSRPVASSHSRIVLSRAPVATVRPSGDTAAL